MTDFKPIIGSRWRHKSWGKIDLYIEVYNVQGYTVEFRMSVDQGIMSNLISNFGEGWVRVINFDEELGHL